MFRKATLVVVAVVLAAASASRAQPDPIARQKIEQTAEAVKRLSGLSYKLKHTAEGLFGLEQKAESEVWMLRSPENPDRWLVHWAGRVKTAGEPEWELLASLDQKSGLMTWVDHPKREWSRRPEREYKTGAMDRRAFAWVSALADADPLADQVSAPEMIIEADAEHDGVMCDVILVKPEKSQPRRWAIGKDDHLPRRVEWVFDGGGLSGRWIFEMSAVQPDPALTPAQFDIPAPDGYRKIEPPPPPPPPPPPGATGTSTGVRGGDPAGNTTTVPTVRARNVGAAVGDLAADFELVKGDVEGTGKEERVRLSSLRGTVVVLDFWGSWNARCKASGSEMKALCEKYKDKPVRVLGMTIRERDKAKPIAYVKDHGYPWTILLDADETAKQYKVRVYPTYLVIGAEGEIVYVATDFEKEKTMAGLAEAIEKALAAAPAPAPAPGGDDGGG